MYIRLRRKNITVHDISEATRMYLKVAVWTKREARQLNEYFAFVGTMPLYLFLKEYCC